jgi:hypothetical protein
MKSVNPDFHHLFKGHLPQSPRFWIALKDGTAGDPPRRSGAGGLGWPMALVQLGLVPWMLRKYDECAMNHRIS